MFEPERPEDGTKDPNASTAEQRRVRSAYGAALAMVLLSAMLSVAIGDNAIGLVVVGLLQGFTLIVTLQVSGARPSVIRASMVLAILATALAAVLTYLQVRSLAPVIPVLWGVIVLGAMISIVRRLSELTEVTVRAILGLLTFYLLLGLLMSDVFAFVGAYTQFFSNAASVDPRDYVYFSFVTLSTTGYGDFTPAAGLPRALAIGEAMLGQLYLVSVVAVAVGRISAKGRLSR